MMKRTLLLYLLTFALLPSLWGQGGSDPCPGWKNPSSFNTGSSVFTWTARVGDRVSGSSVTNGYLINSTCASTLCPDISGHNSITASTHNSGPDQGINCCNHTNLWDAIDKRFMIIGMGNAGIDQFTVNGSNGMPRIPPGYTSSIRLGDPRASRQGAAYSQEWTASAPHKSSEALFYTMRVTPMNALLIINYAVVGRCYDHNPLVAGEFLIRVVKQNDDGSWPNEPINDSLWFMISAPPIPSSGIPDLPWMMGRPCDGTNSNCYCSASTCAYVYKPWAKVAVSLSKYLYKNVRIEMYTSDCVPTVDPVYAYICGDYKPMRINSASCADAYSEAIDTLAAPEGLTQYRWYACTTGPDEDIYNAPHMDSLNFRSLTDTSSSNIYVPTIADFVLTEGPHAGDTASSQTFLCTMVSALDPAKPITSKIYAKVDNNKPTAKFTHTTDCNRSAHFINRSVTFGSTMLDQSATRWYIYSDSAGSSVLDTLWGDEVDYQFPAEGYYRVELHVKVSERDCGAIASDICHVRERVPATIELSEETVCDGESVTAYCTSHCDLDKVWNVDDSLTFTSDGLHSYDSITFVPRTGISTITLTTSRDGLCEASTSVTVKSIGNVTITTNVDASLICQGDSVVLNASGVEDPVWISVPYDSILGDGGGRNIVTVAPTVSTTYIVEPASATRCVQNASSINIAVVPYPIPTIWTSSPYVDITDPKLTIEDLSPYSNSSHWEFSDGLTSDEPRLDHIFGTTGDSVSIHLLTCNELRCCRDTSLTLPVVVNALWIPNTFTPDAGSNERFTFVSTLPVTQFEIWIYNRSGMLVYHSTDFEAGWDGRTAGGDPAPQGAYAYFYRYTLGIQPDRTHTGVGTVTLLR